VHTVHAEDGDVLVVPRIGMPGKNAGHQEGLDIHSVGQEARLKPEGNRILAIEMAGGAGQAQAPNGDKRARR
jgi:hypothetical protein